MSGMAVAREQCGHDQTIDMSFVSGVRRFSWTKCVRCGHEIKSSVGPAYKPTSMPKSIRDSLVRTAKEIGHDTVHGFVLNDGTHLPCDFGSHSLLMAGGFSAYTTVKGDVDWLCYRYKMIKVTGDGDMLMFGGRDGMPSPRQISTMKSLIAKSGVADHCVILDDLHVGSDENGSRLRMYLDVNLRAASNVGMQLMSAPDSTERRRRGLAMKGRGDEA